MGEKVGLEITKEGTITVVAFKAASISDSEGITAATGLIKNFIEKHHPTKIVFDFERVRFFSSQVLDLLLDIRDKLKANGGDVVISAINPQLHRVFKITNLNKIFEFFPDKQSAIQAMASN